MQKIIIETEYSNYSTDVKKVDGAILKDGTQFISVDITGHNWGEGSPCDSKEEAIESIKSCIKSHNLKEKDIEFKDTTGEITKGELFGSDLNKWF